MISLYNSVKLSAKPSGFTLIELLVVLVILGLSSSLLVPDMYNMLQRAQEKTEIAKIKALATLSVERSFFAAATIELQFTGSVLKIEQLATDHDDGEVTSDLKEFKSSHFSFEKTTIAIVNGEWVGSKIVTLTRSPDDELTQLRLRD